MKRNNVKDIRKILKKKLKNKDFVTDKNGSKTIEIVGASFVADKDAIFGKVNREYVQREIEWYESQSLFVDDIPGQTPKIWEMIASENGEINSNYGWCIYSEENGYQYENVLKKLQNNPLDRQANMIYTRPEMHTDATRDGMKDFMCTNNVQYLIRDGKLDAVVNMRSNDVIFGYRNDLAWQQDVLNNLYLDLKMDYKFLKKGKIHWNVGSLHVYERHFGLVK